MAAAARAAAKVVARAAAAADAESLSAAEEARAAEAVRTVAAAAEAARAAVAASDALAAKVKAEAVADQVEREAREAGAASWLQVLKSQGAAAMEARAVGTHAARLWRLRWDGAAAIEARAVVAEEVRLWQLARDWRQRSERAAAVAKAQSAVATEARLLLIRARLAGAAREVRDWLPQPDEAQVLERARVAAVQRRARAATEQQARLWLFRLHAPLAQDARAGGEARRLLLRSEGLTAARAVAATAPAAQLQRPPVRGRKEDAATTAAHMQLIFLALEGGRARTQRNVQP
jgi:hypothetical protein